MKEELTKEFEIISHKAVNVQIRVNSCRMVVVGLFAEVGFFIRMPVQRNVDFDKNNIIRFTRKKNQTKIQGKSKLSIAKL